MYVCYTIATTAIRHTLGLKYEDTFVLYIYMMHSACASRSNFVVKFEVSYGMTNWRQKLESQQHANSKSNMAAAERKGSDCCCNNLFTQVWYLNKSPTGTVFFIPAVKLLLQCFNEKIRNKKNALLIVVSLVTKNN